MVRFTNLRKALEEYSEVLIRHYREELDNGTINASGALKDSLRGICEENGSEFEVIINLMDYWKYIERGRRPGGKMPPLDAIEKWIQVKPIIPRSFNGRVPTDRQLAYLISRKIAVEGIEPKPIMERSIDKTEKECMERIEYAFLLDLEKEVDEILLLFKNV